VPSVVWRACFCHRSSLASGRIGDAPLYPVLDADKRLLGVVTRQDLETLYAENENDMHANNGLKAKTESADEEHVYQLAAVIHNQPVVAYPDEPLRATVYRMAESGHTRFPVVEREHPEQLLGVISLQDLLKARVRNLDEERHRQRVLNMRLLFAPRTTEIESKPELVER
jgi:CBS-domain-containing membrane protein